MGADWLWFPKPKLSETTSRLNFSLFVVGKRAYVEQVAGKQEYKSALCAGTLNTVSANRDHSLSYPLKMS